MTPEKIQEWYDRFRFYSRRPPSVAEISEWLGRFLVDDRPMAAKILDEVLIISEEDIQRGYKEALELIPGWNTIKSRRRGEWVICGFGGAGESGGEMLRKFRDANRLSGVRYDYLFESVAHLASRQLTQEDTVIMVDDFSGTGDQVCNYWPTHSELIGGARAFLILTAATQDALSRMVQLRDLAEILVDHILEPNDNFFAPESTKLTQAQKDRLLYYCRKADRKSPQGFGDCGLALVLSHKTPNNSLPVLHVNKPAWRGLFPRYLNV